MSSENAEGGAATGSSPVEDVAVGSRLRDQRIAHAFAEAPIAISLTRLHDGVILEVNEAFVTMFGFTHEEVAGKTSDELGLWASDADRPALVDGLRAHGATGRDCLLRTRSGGTLTGFVSMKLVGVGESRCILAAVTDVTSRMQTESSLRAAQSKLEAALDSMTDAVFVSDASGQSVDVNDAFATFHRFAAKSESLRNLAEYFEVLEMFFANGEAAPFDMWALPRALRGESATDEEYGLRRRDTGESWVGSYSFGPIRDANGGIVGAVVVARDITEKKRAAQEKAQLEAQLQQAQKMESVGRLAGGVAHDFNNMLGVIIGHAEMALEAAAPHDPVLREDLQEICSAANRSAGLTRQLLAFARKQTVAPRLVDLNNSVDGMLIMLRRLIGENVELIWRPGGGLWPVLIDPTQIDQLVTNLCTNARDAIADVGVVSITTANVMLDSAYCATHPDAVPGDYVQLRFEDTGAGMSRETLANAFEPFFTTKGAGEGTGLGLATVYGIVKQNDGHVGVSSEVGAGTTFDIHLPRYQSSPDSEGRRLVAPEDSTLKRGKETVLLVEDEHAVLRVTKRMLELSGYEVVCAHGPAEALTLAQERAAKIRLVLTDVVMPGMNGRDLADALRAIIPNVRCIYMSGYVAGVFGPGSLRDGESVLQKPVSLKELAAKVRDALDR